MAPHDTTVPPSRKFSLAPSSDSPRLSNEELLRNILKSDQDIRDLSEEFSTLFRKDFANVWTEEARDKLRKTELTMILVLKAYNDLYIHYVEKEIERDKSRLPPSGTKPTIVHLDQVRQSPHFKKFKHIREILLSFHKHIEHKEPTPEWVDQLARTIRRYLFEVEEDVFSNTLPQEIKESQNTIKDQQAFKDQFFALINGYHRFYLRFPELDPSKKTKVESPTKEKPLLPATVAYPVLLDYFISSLDFFIQTQARKESTFEENKYFNYTKSFAFLFRELNAATRSRANWNETLIRSSHYNKFLTLQNVGAPKCILARQILKQFSPLLFSQNTLSMDLVENSFSNDWLIECNKDFYWITTETPKKGMFSIFSGDSQPKRSSKFLYGVGISIRQLTGEIRFTPRNEPFRLPRVVTKK